MRILVHKAGRTIRGLPKNAVGDIIDQRADDWVWGAREQNNAGFLKLDVAGLPDKDFSMQNHQQQNPVKLNVPLLDFTDIDNVYIVDDKRFMVNLALSGINPSSETAAIDVSNLILTDKAGVNTPDNRLHFDIDLQEFVKG